MDTVDITSKSSDTKDKSSSSVSLVCEVFEAVELVPATEGFFKLTEEPFDDPPIKNADPKKR